MLYNFSFLDISHHNSNEHDCIPEANNLFSAFDLTSILHNKNINWCDFVTSDTDNIKYRQELFADIFNIKELSDLLPILSEELETINELYTIRSDKDDNESNLYCIRELEHFICFIETTHSILKSIHYKLNSSAWQTFYKIIEATVNDENYVSLKNGVTKLSISIKNIKSVTVGINLDAVLAPYEAGIISFNENYFHSGDIVSRFMRMETHKDEYSTIAPISVVGKKFNTSEKSIIDTAITGALSKIVGSGLKSWQHMIEKYYKVNSGAYLHLLPEIKFIISSYEAIKNIKSCGYPLCYPNIHTVQEKCFSAKGLYNPILATAYRKKEENKAIVCNDIDFDETGRIYVLTGANRGGKSVFLNSIGIAQLMFQLGLPVAAKSINISPVDHIFTHFTSEAKSTIDKGKFGEECERLQNITRTITCNSLFLFDEMLSGTGAFEASSIAYEVITAISIIGARGIYATHIHEFASKVCEINKDTRVVSKIDNLVMGIDGDRRTYKVSRTEPDGKSYAKDIANTYGLSVDTILRENNTIK